MFPLWSHCEGVTSDARECWVQGLVLGRCHCYQPCLLSPASQRQFLQGLAGKIKGPGGPGWTGAHVSPLVGLSASCAVAGPVLSWLVFSREVESPLLKGSSFCQHRTQI